MYTCGPPSGDFDLLTGSAFFCKIDYVLIPETFQEVIINIWGWILTGKTLEKHWKNTGKNYRKNIETR